MKYVMPAEWEEQEAIWISWPHNVKHWPGNFRPIQPIFAELVKNIANDEYVYICVNDQKMEDTAKKVLTTSKITKEQFEKIRFFHIETDTSWSRDHGPIFVRDEKGHLIITDWIFNTWGGKYPPFDKDDVVPQKIAEQLKFPLIEPRIVLEGGAIEVNGKGSLLTTSQCLLNKNRNPQLSKEQIEKYLNKYIGATNILWLEEGITGDDTDGHIDDIARFANPNTIICAIEKNKNDDNYEILQKNYKVLKKMKDQNGKPFKIVTLPMPDPVYYKKQRLPATYLNFLITNKSVIVPTYRSRHDKTALDVLAKLFTNRKIVRIDCTDLIWGLGAIHCSTQQQPKQ